MDKYLGVGRNLSDLYFSTRLWAPRRGFSATARLMSAPPWAETHPAVADCAIFKLHFCFLFQIIPHAPPNGDRSVENRERRGNKDVSVIKNRRADGGDRLSDASGAQVWLLLVKKLKQRNATARAE